MYVRRKNTVALELTELSCALLFLLYNLAVLLTVFLEQIV